VIFDLDGTLVDTAEDMTVALNAVLGARGLPLHSLDACRAMVGWGMRNLVTAALPEALREPAFIAAQTEAMMAEYGRHPLVHSRPYEGIPELLAELSRRSLPAAVLSNKPDVLTGRILRALFPDHPFFDIQGERPGVPRKPDPQAALALCAGMGLDPREVLFLGDSAVDVETAHNAGMPCAGALWGFRDREELARAGADVLVDHPSAVLDLLSL
jgi:phosphoglycolate phosphatase